MNDFYSIRVINDHFGALFRSRNLNFSVVLNPVQNVYWKTNYLGTYSRIKRKICLDPKKYKYMVDTYKARHVIFQGPQQSDLIKALTADVIIQYGHSLPPSLMISFFHHAPYLVSAFKNSPMVNFSEGGFSGPPFSPTWRFEQGKYLTGPASPGSSATDLPGHDAKAPNKVVDTLRRDSFIALDTINPFKEKLELWRKKYRKLVLLPLQASGRVSFDALCEYENQYHYLIDVVEKMPPEVGVIVTEHPTFPVITESMHDDLICRYPNFIYEADFFLIENVSFYLILYVDAVITVSSSVIWHAALMGKTCCALGTGELTKIVDTNSLHGLNDLLRKEPLLPYRYDALIYKLLTEDWVPAPLMKKPEFIKQWLEYLSSKKHPRPNISDDVLRSLSADGSRNLKFSKRKPLMLMRHTGLPLSLKSVFMRLDSTLLKIALVASPCTKTAKAYILKAYCNFKFVFRHLKRKLNIS